MSNNHAVPISELLEALASDLSAEEILSAKLLAEISTRISAERIKRNMNQAEFAQFMETTQAQVSKWENSNQNFTIKKLAEIACKLNLALNVSFGETVHPQETPKNNIIRFPNGALGSSSTEPTWKQMRSDDDLKEM